MPRDFCSIHGLDTAQSSPQGAGSRPTVLSRLRLEEAQASRPGARQSRCHLGHRLDRGGNHRHGHRAGRRPPREDLGSRHVHDCRSIPDSHLRCHTAWKRRPKDLRQSRRSEIAWRDRHLSGRIVRLRFRVRSQPSCPLEGHMRYRRRISERVFLDAPGRRRARDSVVPRVDRL